MFASPHPNSYVDLLIPKVMSLRGATFRRWLSHEGRALMNEIGALMKEGPENSLAPSTLWGCSKKKAVCNPEKGPHQNPTMLAPWSGLPASSTVRNKFLLFLSHPVYGMLKQPTWAKTTNLNFSVSELRSFPELCWKTHFSSFSPSSLYWFADFSMLYDFIIKLLLCAFHFS